MTELRFNGAVYGCEPPETVLDALTRQDAAVPFFCRNGICLTCMMRSRAGTVPERSQKGLKDTLRLEVISCPASASRTRTSRLSYLTPPPSSAAPWFER